MTSIVFFGSSSHSALILETLFKLPDIDVTTVVTKPDKPFGRQQIVTPNPVASLISHLSRPNGQTPLLLQPPQFDAQFTDRFRDLKPDLALVVAYGPPFFTQELIDIPKHKIVNIHPSPLPKYRGATPGPWQIINGETQSAVTFFQIDPLPDHGPLIAQIPFTIDAVDTADTFYQKAFTLAAANLDSVLTSYLTNPVSNLLPQDHAQKSYFPKLTKAKAQIDWSQPNDRIERFVRAMYSWPTAWTYVTDPNGHQLRLKVISAHLNNSSQLVLDQVQIEGKKPTPWPVIESHYTLLK